MTPTAALIAAGNNTMCRAALLLPLTRGVLQVRDTGSMEDVLFEDIEIHAQHYPADWWGAGEAITVTAIPRNHTMTQARPCSDARCLLPQRISSARCDRVHPAPLCNLLSCAASSRSCTQVHVLTSCRWPGRLEVCSVRSPGPRVADIGALACVRAVRESSVQSSQQTHARQSAIPARRSELARRAGGKCAGPHLQEHHGCHGERHRDGGQPGQPHPRRIYQQHALEPGEADGPARRLQVGQASAESSGMHLLERASGKRSLDTQVRTRWREATVKPLQGLKRKP